MKIAGDSMAGFDDRQANQAASNTPLPARILRNAGITVWMILVLGISMGTFIKPTSKAEVIVRQGDPTPRNDGVFDTIVNPVMAPNGDVAFFSLVNSDRPFAQGIFRYSASKSRLETVVESGDPTPDFNGNISLLLGYSFGMDELGHIVWDAPVTGSLGDGLDDYAIYMTDRDGNTFTLVRENDRIPGGNGRFACDPSNLNLAVMGGSVGFISGIRSISDGPSSIGQGVFRWTPGGIVELARTGEDAPDGGIFSSFKRKRIGMTASGDTVVVATLNDSRSGIFRLDTDSGSMLARTGDALKDGSILDSIGDPSINRAGGAAFRAELSNTPGDQLDNQGVFFAGPDGLREIARKGGFAPQNIGRFRAFDTNVAVNDSGQVLFFAELTGASNGESVGLFLHDGTSIIQVALNNREMPGGDLLRLDLARIRSAFINNAGQVVFAGLFRQSSIGAGFYFFDPATGLHLIDRTGDPFGEDGTINSFSYADGYTGFGGGGIHGLSDSGNVVYAPILEGSKTLVATWSYSSVLDNLPPFSSGFSAVVTQGERLVLSMTSLLAAVTDPEEGPLVVRSVDPTSSGGIAIQYDAFTRSYFLDVPRDFVGEDVFEYLVADDAGATVPVTGRIRVLPVNRAPTGTDWTLGSRYGKTLVVEIARLIGAASDPDGDDLLLSSIDARTNVGRTISRNGDQIVIAVPLIEWVNDHFSYTVSDGRGGNVSIRVTISAENSVAIIGRPSGAVTLEIAAVEGQWTVQRSASVNGPWLDIGVVEVEYEGFGGRRPPAGSALGRGVLVDETPLQGSAFYRTIRENGEVAGRRSWSMSGHGEFPGARKQSLVPAQSATDPTLVGN